MPCSISSGITSILSYLGFECIPCQWPLILEEPTEHTPSHHEGWIKYLLCPTSRMHIAVLANAQPPPFLRSAVFHCACLPFVHLLANLWINFWKFPCSIPSGIIGILNHKEYHVRLLYPPSLLLLGGILSASSALIFKWHTECLIHTHLQVAYWVHHRPSSKSGAFYYHAPLPHHLVAICSAPYP